MKKIVLILLTFSSLALRAQSYNFLGEYDWRGTPLYLEAERDTVSIETLEMISNSLPESYPVPDYNPQYITSGYDTDIKLTKDADVWITFISEGAGYRNVLGFYTYDLENPQSTNPTAEEITIIFPNASALGSGGGLSVGDKVKIGSFKAGTGIGWVLLANAWSERTETVGNGLWQLFSNPNFNPEANESLRHHNVLLADPDNERVILGFEDIRRDYGSCDNDFNDAIFYVTANPYEAIETTNFADIDDATDVSSANDGGLESNGDLANLIAKRNFKREKLKHNLNKKTNQVQFSKNQYQSKSNTTSLVDYLPETGMYKTEIAKVSSPEDLLGITNAKEIFSLDMYEGEQRVSAVLSTATEGGIYDHSKVICDRLNNSSLEDIRTVKVRDHQIIASKINRANGDVEYALSFSIKTDGTTNELFSFWNIDQYPVGNYQNFQIWGSSFSQVFSIANHIIDTHTSVNGLISSPTDNVLPNVFVKSGKYINGVLELEIINKTKETSIDFIGNIAKTEISDYKQLYETFTLSGNYNELLTVQTGVLFDIGMSIATDSSPQKDALYLADGPWGLDYLETEVTVNDYAITTTNRVYDASNFDVDRNVYVSGDVKGNVNVFRHLLAGDQTVTATDYNFINAEIFNSQDLEIVVMQDDNRAWENRLRYILPASSSKREVNIDFEMFKDASGNTATIKNVKTIVFSIIGNFENYQPFQLGVDNLSLSPVGSVLSSDDFIIETDNNLNNYPNPFSVNTTIVLPNTSNSITIKVFDLLGRAVDIKKIETTNNKKTVAYKAPKVTPGIYKYILEDDTKGVHKGTFVITN